MSKEEIITYLRKRLITNLDELLEDYDNTNQSEFLLGGLYAYTECLEIILQSEGVDNDTLLALEQHYGIR